MVGKAAEAPPEAQRGYGSVQVAQVVQLGGGIARAQRAEAAAGNAPAVVFHPHCQAHRVDINLHQVKKIATSPERGAWYGEDLHPVMQGTLHTCMFCAPASMLLLTSSSTATARLVMMQSERSFSITC